MAGILDQIIEDKADEVAVTRAEGPGLEDLKSQCHDLPAPRNFHEALSSPSDHMRVIAEVKKASPSAGLIREDFDPVGIAQAYEANGARAISCLTDQKYFQGELSFLKAIRGAVELPLLRKDFMIDPYQVYEARVAGADAILLIAECIDDEKILELGGIAGDLGMSVLFEVHAVDSLDRANRLLGQFNHERVLLGINNRDLTVMKTDLNHTLKLLNEVPDLNQLVSESGIRTHEDVKMLREHGVNSVLVGEHLMRQPNVGEALGKMIFGESLAD